MFANSEMSLEVAGNFTDGLKLAISEISLVRKYRFSNLKH